MHSATHLSFNTPSLYPDFQTKQNPPKKLFVLKCLTDSKIQTLQIHLNPLDKKIHETLLDTLKNHFPLKFIKNSNITIDENRISISSKETLLGGGKGMSKFPGKVDTDFPERHSNSAIRSSKWQEDEGQNKYLLEQFGSWFELCYSDPEQVPGIRKTLLSTILVNFPFDSTFSYSPLDTKLIIRFCIPNSTYTQVIFYLQTYLQGKSSTSLEQFKPMRIGRTISPQPVSIETLAIMNLRNLTPLPDDTLYRSLKTFLKIDELCLFHFMSKEIKDPGDSLVLKRQIKKNGILSKSCLNKWAFLSTVEFGVTSLSDRNHNDHFYVHCFLGYLSNSNHLGISNRVTNELSILNPLHIAFRECKGAIFFPYDQCKTFNIGFKDREKMYSITINENDFIINYKRDNEILFTHHFTEEIFDTVDGLFFLLLKFIRHLDLADQKDLFNDDGATMKELFNVFFAFRAQVSFPDHLPYDEYFHPNLPKEKLRQFINRQEVLKVPDLQACEKQFQMLLQKLTPEVFNISPKILNSLVDIGNFFRRDYKDNINSFSNYYAYLGGISAQLAIHFDPEICHEFTPEVLKVILQIHLYLQKDNRKNNKLQDEFQHFYNLILIKKLDTHDITIFSIIEHSLQDLDTIQMRMPPNSRFDTQNYNAESAYLEQLTSFYQHGSELLRSISILSSDEPSAMTPMIPFSPEKHLNIILKYGIDFLSRSQKIESHNFSNLHGYSKKEFLSEFHSGLNKFIFETEYVYGGVIQANIKDFAQALLEGCSLLTPRYKHDILDSKHFKVGINFDYPHLSFLDGQFTFRDLIVSALYIMSNQQTLSVNGQLIADAMHVLMIGI